MGFLEEGLGLLRGVRMVFFHCFNGRDGSFVIFVIELGLSFVEEPGERMRTVLECFGAKRASFFHIVHLDIT